MSLPTPKTKAGAAPCVMGIDPGTTRVGFGILRGVTAPELVAAGILSLSSKPDASFRYLEEIAREFKDLLARYRPSLIAVERLYVAANSKAVLLIAEARGVILLGATQAGIPIVEYAPSSVKKIVTGSGTADKRTVALMVKHILKAYDLKGPDDVTDALALALAAAGEYRFRSRLAASEKSRR